MNDSSEPIPGSGSVTQGLTQEKPSDTVGERDIDQAGKDLISPRAISKRRDQEGRDEIAREVLETRASKQTTEKAISDKEHKLKEVEEQEVTQFQAREQKAEKLSQRVKSLFVRLKATIGISDQKAARLQDELNTLETQVLALISETLGLKEELEVLRENQAKIPDAKRLVKDYYEEKKDTPLSNEEKRQVLKPEFLASLSTEEYIALWRRLNPYFLSHVTRQGFRDHNAMMYHQGGLKEFHNGFINITGDHRMLRPPLSIMGLRNRDEASIGAFLGDWVLTAETGLEAKDRFYRFLNESIASAPKYPDIISVHFATQLVANRFYGGETGNEVFLSIHQTCSLLNIILLSMEKRKISRKHNLKPCGMMSLFSRIPRKIPAFQLMPVLFFCRGKPRSILKQDQNMLQKLD